MAYEARKKIDASAKALSPPTPELLADARFCNAIVFYMYKNTCFDQEKPDEFEERNTLVLKLKTFSFFSNIFLKY